MKSRRRMRVVGVSALGLLLAGCKDVNETVTNESETQKMTQVVVVVYVSRYDQAPFPAHEWYEGNAPDEITDLGFHSEALKIKKYRLVWNVAVQPGETFHYGWNWLVNKLHYTLTSRAASWSDATTCATAGLGFTAARRSEFGAVLEVSHSSAEHGPIVVEALQWTAVVNDVPLDNLVWGDPVAEALPWVDLPIAVPFELGPGSPPLVLDIPDEQLEGFNWGLIRYAASDVSCPLGHDAFYQSALPLDIPTLSEWGLIVLTLLVFTVGTVVLGRVRRSAAA